jgi:hypothetical protein
MERERPVRYGIGHHAAEPLNVLERVGETYRQSKKSEEGIGVFV